MTFFHYTTTQALESIVKNRSFRLTDCQFLTDRKEFKYYLETFCEVWREKVAKLDESQARMLGLLDFDKMLVKDVEEYLYEVGIYETVQDLLSGNPKHYRRFFVLSCTDAEDDMAMWSAYAKDGGCCLELDLEALESLIEDPCPSRCGEVVTGPVKYSSAERRRNAETFVDGLFLKFRDLSPERMEGFSDEDNQYAESWLEEGWAMDVADEVISGAAFIKGEGYSFEREHRFLLGYNVTDDAGQNLPVSLGASINRQGIVAPHAEIQLGERFSEVVRSVRVAPFGDVELAARGMRVFLDQNGLRDIEVRRSAYVSR